jgi:hypothetical protein
VEEQLLSPSMRVAPQELEDEERRNRKKLLYRIGLLNLGPLDVKTLTLD